MRDAGAVAAATPTEVPRVAGLTPERFVADFVVPNRPVVVTDALDGWHLAERWTPAALSAKFGNDSVQIYNDYFDLTGLMKLSKYLAENFGVADRGSKKLPYVRWYTKLRDVKFPWADQAFARMRGDWARPGFLPATGYAMPFAPDGAQGADPTADPFPAKGLFVSPRGGQTGLHTDPWGSDAVLCQLYGTKTWVMYPPSQRPLLTDGADTVDLDAPDRARFPRVDEAVGLRFSIGPGDTVYVPHGWLHQVRTDTDSISLTWNFVLAANAAAFRRWLGAGQAGVDESVLRFFFGPHVTGEPLVAAIDALIDRTFPASADPTTPR